MSKETRTRAVLADPTDEAAAGSQVHVMDVWALELSHLNICL